MAERRGSARQVAGEKVWSFYRRTSNVTAPFGVSFVSDEVFTTTLHEGDLLLYSNGHVPHSTEAVVAASMPTPGVGVVPLATRSVHGNLYFDDLESRLWSPAAIRRRCHGALGCSVHRSLLDYCPSVALALQCRDSESSACRADGGGGAASEL
jgi:hypothetical protein